MFVCAECGASQPVPGNCTADGSQLQSIGDDVLLGQTIGAYRVARLLGVGGMGRVYKGVHPQIGSRVAIKVLSRECSDRRDLVERFFAEAKAVNVIRHESIVNVLDLSVLPDGRPYIVMEYLDGAPLSSIIEHARSSGQQLPLGGLARLTAEVLDALSAAHAKGIVHRDVKPDNIYVTPAGRAKVLDFGIAKLQPELGGSATQAGSLLGTPHYMSPEQAAGRPVDLRADLYAIGVILFECATLHRPFVAEALFDLLRMHVDAPPPSPRMIRRDMPESLEQVIFAALAKSPDQRFGNAHAMSMALQHATSQLAADQWTPIQPAQGSRHPGGSWAPTPPASWARPQPSTQTAGQVASTVSTPSSNKGIWLVAGAVLVAGGGITAAVIASKDKSPPAAQPTTIVTPTPTPAPVAPVAPAIDPWTAELPPETTAQMDKAFGDMIANLPEQARSALPPEIITALGKYGAWSKIPDAERKVLIGVMMNSAMTGDFAADLDDALSTAPSNPTTADGWVQMSSLPPPPGFDASKADPQKHVTWAIAEAKKLVPDAVLFRMSAGGLAPDGTANLGDVDDDVDYRFISPSRSKRDPKKPIGSKVEHRCMFRISIDEEGAHVYPMDGWECKEPLIGVPKCTFGQIWQKALAKGAPRNAIATIGYWAGIDDKATWYFSIPDNDEGFSSTFRDDC